MDNKNEVDSFLEDLKDEPDQDPFQPTTEDPLALEEVKKEDQEIDEKPLPFNKDPKVQKFIEKEISKRLATVKPTETEKFAEEVGTDDEAIDVLTRIIGNDTPEKKAAIKDFHKVLSGLEERGAQKAIAQLERQAEQERQQDVDAENELTQGFETVEEEFGVDLTSNSPTAKKTRGEFINFITRVAPKDEEGQVIEFPDFEETFKLFQETRQNSNSSRAKQLSSRSMTRSSTTSNTQPVSGKSWKDVDRLFSKFTN